MLTLNGSISKLISFNCLLNEVNSIMYVIQNNLQIVID